MHDQKYNNELIQVANLLGAINEASVREKMLKPCAGGIVA